MLLTWSVALTSCRMFDAGKRPVSVSRDVSVVIPLFLACPPSPKEILIHRLHVLPFSPGWCVTFLTSGFLWLSMTRLSHIGYPSVLRNPRGKLKCFSLVTVVKCCLCDKVARFKVQLCFFCILRLVTRETVCFEGEWNIAEKRKTLVA